MNPLLMINFEWLGQILLHFVWQGALIAIVLALILGCQKQASASTHYRVLGLGMLCMLLAPAWTAWHLRDVSTLTTTIPHEQSLELADLFQEFALSNVFEEESLTFTGKLAGFWLIGVLLLGLLRFLQWCRVIRLTLPGHLLPAPESITNLLRPIQERLGIRQRVNLACSPRVRVPCVIGAWWPKILLPVSILTSLDENQLKAVIAHELMHIKRHDYLINLLQTAIETLFFYHPAVWWVGRRLRLEREHCCDDGALSVCQDPARYGQALLCLEEARLKEEAFAMASTGKHASGLAERVRRLLQPQTEVRTPFPSLSLSLLGIAVVTAFIWWTPQDQSLANPPIDPESAETETADPTSESAHGAKLARQFLQGQVDDLKREIQEKEHVLHGFRQKHLIVESNGSRASDKLETLDVKLAVSMIELVEMEIQLQSICSIDDAVQLSIIPAIVEYGPVLAYKDKLDANIEERAQLDLKYLPRHPKIMGSDKERVSLTELLRASVKLAVDDFRNRVAQKRQQHAELELALADAETAILRENSPMAQFKSMQSELAILKDYHNLIRNRLSETQIAAQLEQSKVDVITPAALPEESIDPDKK